jgi:phage-related tail fiber protein
MVRVDRQISVSEGTAIKAPCKAATTANITLSGEQTIDGVSCVEDDRVLVKNQTDGTENGIYTVSTGNWSRALDCDGAYDVVRGTRVFVNQGTVSALLSYAISTADPITVGTTSLTWTADSSATAVASAAAAAASAAAASASETAAAASAVAAGSSRYYFGNI